jgi:predicted amidohydrolase YtcJ
MLLQRGSHNVVANSQAFELASIEPDVPNPPGGTFVRAADGSLTGYAIGAEAADDAGGNDRVTSGGRGRRRGGS